MQLETGNRYKQLLTALIDYCLRSKHLISLGESFFSNSNVSF